MDWGEQFKDKNCEECVDIFYKLTSPLIEDCVPAIQQKTSKQRAKPPWMNKSARKQIRKKDCAWKRYQLSNSYNKYMAYIKVRDKTNRKLRQIKKEFEKKLAADCKINPKAFYKYANFKSKANKKVIRLKDENGIVSMSDEKNANILNTYFTSVFTDEPDVKELIFSNSTKQMWDTEEPEQFQFNGTPASAKINSINLDKETVKKYLCQIDPTKSTTPECIHPRILKECAESLTDPLYIIYKHSLETGSVPPQWKNGTVTAIHKDESRHDAKNYRPITITSQLCRILEKIIKDSLIDHMENNNILTDRQHGFTSNRSCLTNLLKNLEEIYL